MGMIVFDIVMPAILINHPNITKEEYAKYFLQSSTRFLKIDAPTRKLDFDLLARNLRIEYSEEYQKFISQDVDNNNIPFDKPYFNEERLTVSFNIKNKLEPIVSTNFDDHQELCVGDLIHYCYDEDALIIKINSISDIIDIENNRTYNLDVCPVKRTYEIHKFSTIDELYKEFPMLHIDNKYNWKKEAGFFNILDGNRKHSRQNKKFSWLQKNGLYSLDPITFNRLHSSSYETYDEEQQEKLNCKPGEAGYIDLILVSEFLKHGSKARFSLPGHNENYLSQLFNEHPSSKGIYAKAVKDSFYSQYAKYNDLSTFDMLRMRALFKSTSNHLKQI